MAGHEQRSASSAQRLLLFLFLCLCSSTSAASFSEVYTVVLYCSSLHCRYFVSKDGVGFYSHAAIGRTRLVASTQPPSPANHRIYKRAQPLTLLSLITAIADATAFNHSSNNDAEAEYDRLRDLAREEAQKRNSCFDRVRALRSQLANSAPAQEAEAPTVCYLLTLLRIV